MDRLVKVIHLTTNQTLISELVEVAPMDIGAPDCKMVNPFTVTEEADSISPILEPWLLNVTKDDVFMISSDKILTLVDPTPTLLEKYLDLIK